MIPDSGTTGMEYCNNEEVEMQSNGRTSWFQSVSTTIKRHRSFIGPGVIASVAYIDPGNWATDLSAGSKFGYSHLFVILLSTLIAMLYQILAARLGIVTGIDLASHCRNVLHNRPNHKLVYRWGLLYPLYCFSEIGIIFTDMAELLGSAIAINLLAPAIPLPACVVLTSFDILVIIFLFNNYPARMLNRSMQIFELLIGVLVLTVLGSFVALLVRVQPDWNNAFRGFIPSSGIVDNGAIFIAVGILGATIQPQAFFIGSKLAAVQRISPAEYESNSIALQRTATEESGRTYASANQLPSVSLPTIARLRSTRSSSSLQRMERSDTAVNSETAASTSLKATPSTSISEVFVRPSLACVTAHLGHAQFDIAASLIGFAVVINSAILIVAAAVFYYDDRAVEGVTDLFAAYELVRSYIGPAFGYLFAVGLLASGQAASIVVTLSGQVLSEGFLQWNIRPWKRKAITRSIGIVPALIVAIAVGKSGIDVLLIGSQVALSFILPFVIAPLIYLTSCTSIMSVALNPNAPSSSPVAVSPIHTKAPALLPALSKRYSRLQRFISLVNPLQPRKHPAGYQSFANSVAITWLCWTIWIVISVANIMAIHQIVIGDP